MAIRERRVDLVTRALKLFSIEFVKFSSVFDYGPLIAQIGILYKHFAVPERFDRVDQQLESIPFAIPHSPSQ